MQFSETVQVTGVGLDAYFPNDKVTFDTLDVTFLVDEDLENFKEIYDWMDAIVLVHDPSSYSTLTKSTSTQSKLYQKAESDSAQMSDITLVINTNKNIF